MARVFSILPRFPAGEDFFGKKGLAVDGRRTRSAEFVRERAQEAFAIAAQPQRPRR